MDSIKQKQQVNYQINRNRKLLSEENQFNKSSPKTKYVAPEVKNEAPKTQQTHILLSDLLQKNNNQSYPSNTQQPEREPRIRQLSRGGAGFSLTQHKLARKSRNAKHQQAEQNSFTSNPTTDVMRTISNQQNCQNLTLRPQTAIQLLQEKVVPMESFSTNNNRYNDKEAKPEDTFLMDAVDKGLLDDENVYGDQPPLIVNKQGETSIEVGIGEIGTTVKSNELNEGNTTQQIQQFNITVLGRHKISSKEYRNSMKSQKNQSMSDISVFGQSDEVSQNPMFNQQRLKHQGESSQKELCPYFNKGETSIRPLTAYNQNLLTQRNQFSNSAASMRLTPGRSKSRNALFKQQSSQSRNVLSNNIIDLNFQLNKEYPPILTKPSARVQNLQLRVQSVPIKGSRPKTAMTAANNNVYLNLYQKQINLEVLHKKTQVSQLSGYNHDQRSQLTKSFRALSKGVTKKTLQKSRCNNYNMSKDEQASLNDSNQRMDCNDQPQFFTKQLKLESTCPNLRKLINQQHYNTSQSKINKIRQYHLNSYLNQELKSAETNQQQTTLEYHDLNSTQAAAVGASKTASLEARGCMQVVIPLVKDNEDARAQIYGYSNKISNRRTSSQGRGSLQQNSNRRQSKNELHNTIESREGSSNKI